VVKNEVAPAYAKFANSSAKDYAPHGRPAIPASEALPDGEARYRFAIPSSDRHDFHRRPNIHELGVKSWRNRNPDALDRQGREASQSEIVQRTYPAGSETARPSRAAVVRMPTPAIATRCMASCRSYSDACPRTSWTWCRWNRSGSASARPPIIPSGAEMARRPGRNQRHEYAPEKTPVAHTWKPSPITRAYLDIDLQCFDRARNSRDCRRSANSILDLNAYTEAGRSTPSVWEKKWDSIRTRTANTDAFR